MRHLLLTADDFTKEYSNHWPRKSIVQWIEDTFGYDDDVCEAAYTEAFLFINGDQDDITDNEYSIGRWSERESVTYDQIASCWNSVARRLGILYGDRQLMPRQEEHISI